MLYVRIYGASHGDAFQQVNSSYDLDATIQMAQLTLDNPQYTWADRFEIVDERDDVLAVGVRPEVAKPKRPATVNQRAKSIVDIAN